MGPRVIVVGAGGHGRVVADALALAGARLMGFADADPARAHDLPAGAYLGADDAVFAYDPAEVMLANGVGGAGSTQRRREVYERFAARGFRFAVVVHPAAVVARSARLEPGAQVLAGAVVQPGAVVEADAIVNTRASVDHDCRIGAHAHIAPGATLCGEVTVGPGAHIGTGASVIQGVTIGAGALVAAGAAVVGDVPEGVRVAGVPARRMDA